MESRKNPKKPNLILDTSTKEEVKAVLRKVRKLIRERLDLFELCLDEIRNFIKHSLNSAVMFRSIRKVSNPCKNSVFLIDAESVNDFRHFGNGYAIIKVNTERGFIHVRRN